MYVLFMIDITDTDEMKYGSVVSCEGKYQALISRYQTTKTTRTVVAYQSVDRRKQ